MRQSCHRPGVRAHWLGTAVAMTDEQHGGGDSKRTIVVAVIANLAIAVAKTVAALLTGSTSMWAEAAHSLADTGNEVLLFVGLRRSVKRPDERHPFGYGQERYFWAFLAALGIFLIGGALSIGEGIRSLLLPEPVESLWVGIGVQRLHQLGRRGHPQPAAARAGGVAVGRHRRAGGGRRFRELL